MKITRKKFIKKMGLTIANSLLTGLSFPNCFIDMEYSPFQTNVTHSNLNQLNLMMIKQIEQSKGFNQPFNIALFSDTHHYFQETEKVVHLINARDDLDFAIIIGDITDIGLLTEFEWSYDIIKRLNIPYMMAIGNHDCLSKGIDIYEKMFGSLNYTFNYMGVEFIFFNNNNWESGYPDYNWLSTTSSQIKADKKVLFSHINNSNDAYNRFTVAEINRFNEIVHEHFSLVIHGHAHVNSSYVLIDGIPRYEIGSPGYGHYMIASYDGDSFEVERCRF